MAIETLPFDAAELLDTPEAAAEYLKAAFETGDPAFIQDSLGMVARARGMTQLARETGLSRQALYRALSREGGAELSTIVKVMAALGLRLDPVPADTAA